MALHRALRFAQKGIENLKVESVARPTRLQPNDAIVQVKAAAINPSDLKNVLGMFPHTTYPRTPGRDFSGVVVEGPAEWVGKEVWGSGSLGIVSDGTHAEYVVVDAGALAEKPSHLSFEAAAAIPVGFVTAWIAMVEKTNVQPGDAVVVIGARGQVGNAAAQIAKFKKAGLVIGAIRGKPEDLPNPTQHVDAWISLDDGVDSKAEVFKLTNGKGANVVFDTVGGAQVEKSLSFLGVRGRTAHISVPSEPTSTFNLFNFYRSELTMYGVNTINYSDAYFASVLNALAPGFESGALTAPTFVAIPLDKGPEAYKQQQAGSRNKLVIIP